MNKNNNGITLIALIITIIVMLILVAVTINMAVNGGLFGYAGNAAKDTETAKQKELDWLNVDGMTTDQLISKYTSDPEKDLEILRTVLAYVYEIKDMADMTAEEETMWNTYHDDLDSGEYIEAEVFPLNSDWYLCCKYHNAYYKCVITYVNDEPTDLTVEPYNPTEADRLGIFASEIREHGMFLSRVENDDEGIDYSFYSYNEKTYMIVETLPYGVTNIEDISSKTVVLGENDIIVLELANETTTWYQWAINPNDNSDLDLGYLQTGLTLKKLIQYVNAQQDKMIKYDETNPIVISENENYFSKPRVVLCIYAYLSGLHQRGDSGIIESSEYILPGTIYCFDKHCTNR